MDYLWTPWRYRYVSDAGKSDRCVFCETPALQPSQDREHLLLYRGGLNYVLMNLFPYTTGHCMVIPYAHVADLDDVTPETLAEMMELAGKVKKALEACYHPDGYNLGMNVGQCAGAGLADHIHLHVLPRWIGDSSFMTAVSETRILPEDLLTTYDKLLSHWRL
jgi:ATP adenylyltransferase